MTFSLGKNGFNESIQYMNFYFKELVKNLSKNKFKHLSKNFVENN